MHFYFCKNLNDISCGYVRKYVMLSIIFIRFGSKLYRQIVGIPMGTNCAPLVADLFLFCYERNCMLSSSDNNHFVYWVSVHGFLVILSKSSFKKIMSGITIIASHSLDPDHKCHIFNLICLCLFLKLSTQTFIHRSQHVCVLTAT